ncbi:MAG: hypothetical protein ACXU88_00370 [Myxococcaceae bacterium]
MSRMREQARGASQLMMAFAERTGLTSDRPQVRYLWTDAFAVCNFLSLARETGEQQYVSLALRLVDQTHQVLARHRADDGRVGWISGLSEAAGAAHPTLGGLRIGKKLPERRPGEPFHEQLEWERDGQYFHYLTKWMHALDQMARFTTEPRFNLWARELAEVSHAAFTYVQPGRNRRQLAWKMSVDLSRPLVSSAGQHDPLDGLVTYSQLIATASRLCSKPDGPTLQEEVADLIVMSRGSTWETDDPLGLGGLLTEACRVDHLLGRRSFPDPELLPALLAAAREGLRRYAANNDLQESPLKRLAFRELGLSIGLYALGVMLEAERGGFDRSTRISGLLSALAQYRPLGSPIQTFWLEPRNRDNATWTAHRDINDVMLATSLIPEGFLTPFPLA